ncbi:MAG TPA: hypothetical protein VK337_19485 [Xanthobacteraceae bacterium]|nr:hypothetical protein [Xanthobacteraceae bacterium]
MQMSQTQRDFTQMRRRQRISFFRLEPTDLAVLIGFGPRLGDACAGAHNLENADVVGPSGMAMIAVITDCCEVTA